MSFCNDPDVDWIFWYAYAWRAFSTQYSLNSLLMIWIWYDDVGYTIKRCGVKAMNIWQWVVTATLSQFNPNFRLCQPLCSTPYALKQIESANKHMEIEVGCQRYRSFPWAPVCGAQRTCVCSQWLMWPKCIDVCPLIRWLDLN